MNMCARISTHHTKIALECPVSLFVGVYNTPVLILPLLFYLLFRSARRRGLFAGVPDSEPNPSEPPRRVCRGGWRGPFR